MREWVFVETGRLNTAQSLVARNVAAKIGKFDALALAFASPLAFHSPPKYLAADQLHAFQASQKLWTKQAGLDLYGHFTNG